MRTAQEAVIPNLQISQKTIHFLKFNIQITEDFGRTNKKKISIMYLSYKNKMLHNIMNNVCI